jgi:hypothetical protein
MDDRQLSVVEREALGECFDSAEARYEYEKALRLRRVLKSVGAVVGLVAFGVFMYWLGGGRRLQADSGGASPTDDGHGHQGKQDVQPVGSPEAKVKVLAILPVGSDCHSNIVKFLTETATKRQDQIRVEFTTMDAFGTKKLEQQVGASCAVVMINGTAAFEVVSKGEKRQISLVGTEPTHYSVADVGEALTSVFIKEYGDPGEPIYTAPAGGACGGPASGGHGHAGGPSALAPKAGTKAEPEEPLELLRFREIKTTP